MRYVSYAATICAAALLAVGGAWLLLGLGDVPHYGDTIEYLALARTLEVDDYRGILYPAFLAGMDRLLGAPSILRPFLVWHETGPCDLSPNFVGVQLVQAALSLAACVYFVFVFAARTPGGARACGWRAWTRLALVGALLCLDPLVAHFDLSVMTDGPALAGSLVFCAALVDLRWRRTPPLLAGTLFVLSFLLTAGLRAEKRWVLLATVALTLLAWWLLRPRARAAAEGGSGKAALVILAVATAAAFATVTLVQRAHHRETGRWPLVSSMLQQRVVFPNVVATHDALPEWIRRKLPPPSAEYFDLHHQNGRQVIDQVTRGDAAERERMVREMAAVAWRARWGRIVLDVLKDAGENVLATPSFYVRLATYAARGEQGFRQVFHSDGTRWTYTRLEQHEPLLSRVYVSLAGALFLLTLVLALARLRAARRAERGRPTRETLAYYAPLACFAALNAGLFAVSSDLVHVRYALLAHVALLLLVYSAAFPASGAREPAGGTGQCT